MTDERCKQLMERVGLPDSVSLQQALFQVANETEQEVRASIAKESGEQHPYWKKMEAAIDALHEAAAIAKREEPDDFDYGILQQLDKCAQKTLYMLTRGARGEKCGFTLSVLPASERP